MLHPDTTVRESPIAGLGVFATRRIPRGTVTWVRHPDFDQAYVDEWIEERFAKSPELRRFFDWYAYRDGDLYVLCCDNARFMNHSCSPNTADVGNGWVDVAIRDIEEGEEVTFDAGLFGGLKAICNCGYEHCRKAIKPRGEPTVAELVLVDSAISTVDSVPQPLGVWLDDTVRWQREAAR